MSSENDQSDSVRFGAGVVLPSLRQRAIRLLAGRERSRAELIKKLAEHGTADEITVVLDELTELGLCLMNVSLPVTFAVTPHGLVDPASRKPYAPKESAVSLPPNNSTRN